jgi:hypothetical protein
MQVLGCMTPNLVHASVWFCICRIQKQGIIKCMEKAEQSVTTWVLRVTLINKKLE